MAYTIIALTHEEKDVSLKAKDPGLTKKGLKNALEMGRGAIHSLLWDLKFTFIGVGHGERYEETFSPIEVYIAGPQKIPSKFYPSLGDPASVIDIRPEGVNTVLKNQISITKLSTGRKVISDRFIPAARCKSFDPWKFLKLDIEEATLGDKLIIGNKLIITGRDFFRSIPFVGKSGCLYEIDVEKKSIELIAVVAEDKIARKPSVLEV